jgi:hypothetical protein
MRKQMVVKNNDYSVPVRKAMKLNFGVIYKEKDIVIEGGEYSKKPN